MTRTLERAMDSDVEAHAVNLAMECAATLLAYYRTEVRQDGTAINSWLINCDEAWRDHELAVRYFQSMFPQIVDWRELVSRDGARTDRGRAAMSDGRPHTFCRYTATITYRSGKMQTLTELEPVTHGRVRDGRRVHRRAVFQPRAAHHGR